MIALTVIHLFGCANVEVPIATPHDAVTTLAFDDAEVLDIKPLDYNGDGLSDLLVRVVSDGHDRADLFDGALLVDGGLITGKDAHITLRGEIDGISVIRDLHGDGRDAVALGSRLAWGLFEPDDLIEPGPRAILEPSVLFDGDGKWMLGVTGGDMGHDGQAELVISVATPGENIRGRQCSIVCFGWDWKQSLEALYVASVAELSDSWTPGRRQPFQTNVLDNIFADYAVELIGDVDGDGTRDLISGGGRNYAAVTLRGTRGGAVGRKIPSMFCYSSSREIISSPPSCGREVRIRSAGDVDGDGLEDVIVTSYVSSDLIAGAAVRDDDAGRRRQLGAQAVGAGDLDNDGKGDLAIVNFEGEASLHLGNAKDNKSALLHFAGFDTTHLSVNEAGDIDGDGWADLAIVHERGIVSIMSLGSLKKRW